MLTGNQSECPSEPHLQCDFRLNGVPGHVVIRAQRHQKRPHLHLLPDLQLVGKPRIGAEPEHWRGFAGVAVAMSASGARHRLNRASKPDPSPANPCFLSS